MREIKFRAWDRDHNKMLTNITEIWRLDHATNLASHESDHNNLRLGWMDDSKFGYWRDIIPKQIDLMQYTGLKDKNGKEIYEGDLGYFDIAPNNLIEIKIEEGAVSYWSLFNMGHKFEVVGNIYERPNLLNSEQNVEECDATEDKSGNKS